MRSLPAARRLRLTDPDHKLILNKDDVERGRQHDLDAIGVAKNAREEKVRARDEKLKAQQEAKDREMEKLYRKHVLGEKEPEGGFVPLSSIAPVPGEERSRRRKSAASATNLTSTVL